MSEMILWSNIWFGIALLLMFLGISFDIYLVRKMIKEAMLDILELFQYFIDKDGEE